MSHLNLIDVNQPIKGSVDLPLSKSIYNRLHILQRLYPQIDISGLPEAEDCLVLQKSKEQSEGVIDVGHAGTAMRFLTAFYAIGSGCVNLVGSERMEQRPIEPLVSKLIELGASVSYLKKEGYPPLQVQGRSLEGGEIDIEASMSSQFISALMMIAPKLKKGLVINLKGEVVSAPYLHMTQKLMQSVGLNVVFEEKTIRIPGKQEAISKKVFVEKDWSAAAFWYAFVAIADDAQIFLEGLHLDSIQGDCELVHYFEYLGVQSKFVERGMLISKKEITPSFMHLDLSGMPDVAQALFVSAVAREVPVKLKGLSTLKIKETDRLLALQKELKKCGVEIEVDAHSISYNGGKLHAPTVPFDTYQDHRMAMCLAPLALKFSIDINNPEVVVKSYPNFWDHLSALSVNH